jgi:predicted DNA-binding transcriptional regulator AlpA
MDEIKLYRLRELSARIGLARSAIYQAINDGRFEPPRASRRPVGLSQTGLV